MGSILTDVYGFSTCHSVFLFCWNIDVNGHRCFKNLKELGVESSIHVRALKGTNREEKLNPHLYKPVSWNYLGLSIAEVASQDIGIYLMWHPWSPQMLSVQPLGMLSPRKMVMVFVMNEYKKNALWIVIIKEAQLATGWGKTVKATNMWNCLTKFCFLFGF